MPQDSYTDLEEKLARAQRERDEALEQQFATSEVLRVISSSPGELTPVFKSILENATRLCEAESANLFLYEDECFRAVALHGAPAAYAERRRNEPVFPVRHLREDLSLARLARTKKLVHVADVTSERAYIDRDPRTVALVELAGARTFLVVPMLKESKLVGAIAIYRQEVRPFTGKQIELVKSFASQAVIAIENTRLLKELRQRTSDLSEALERQTATSEVLEVISSSPGELEPVFEAMLEKAVRICEAKFGTLYLSEGNGDVPADVEKGGAALLALSQ